MAVIFFRMIIFYIVLMFSLRFMGKRQLGEFEPVEFVVTILISEVASIPLQDPESPIINSFITIAVLICLEVISSAVSMKSIVVRRFFQGRCSILISDGVINQKEMKKLHLTIDDLLEELRQHGAISVSEVRYCMLETSGKMSVILKKDVPPSRLPISIIVNGTLINENMEKAKIDIQAVKDYLADNNTKINDVFWLLYSNGEFILTRSEGDN